MTLSVCYLFGKDSRLPSNLHQDLRSYHDEKNQDVNMRSEERLKCVPEKSFGFCHPSQVGDTFYIAGSTTKKISEEFEKKRGIQGKGKRIAIRYEAWPAVIVSTDNSNR